MGQAVVCVTVCAYSANVKLRLRARVSATHMHARETFHVFQVHHITKCVCVCVRARAYVLGVCMQITVQLYRAGTAWTPEGLLQVFRV
jgi:hypothetical protein